jgi:hypothetical protein
MLGKRTLTLFALLLFSISYLSVLVVSGLGQRRGEKIEGNPPKLKIELQLFKPQHLLREPIWARCKVTNVGTKPGKFYFDNLDALVIKDSKGEVYPCSIAIERVPITIKPGESLEKEGDLLGYYGVSENKFRLHRYLPPEKYIVYYELNQAVGSEKYKVYAKSQVDSFEVLLPMGDELSAMNLLKESYEFFMQRKWQESTNKMREIFQKYPKSRYAPFALLRTANTLQEFYKLIEDYPTSMEAVRAVPGIADIFKRKKDKAGYIDAMNNLMKKSPNSDISKEAEKQLKQVKDKDFE